MIDEHEDHTNWHLSQHWCYISEVSSILESYLGTYLGHEEEKLVLQLVVLLRMHAYTELVVIGLILGYGWPSLIPVTEV